MALGFTNEFSCHPCGVHVVLGTLVGQTGVTLLRCCTRNGNSADQERKFAVSQDVDAVLVVFAMR